MTVSLYCLLIGDKLDLSITRIRKEEFKYSFNIKLERSLNNGFRPLKFSFIRILDEKMKQYHNKVAK